jgi:hypothetical protein
VQRDLKRIIGSIQELSACFQLSLFPLLLRMSYTSSSNSYLFEISLHKHADAKYRISGPIRRIVIFSLEISEKKTIINLF